MPQTNSVSMVPRIVGLSLLVVASVAVASKPEYFTLEQIRAAMAGFGAWQVPVFVAVYVVGTLLFAPGSVLTIAGGALFGPWLGGFVSLCAATLGACAAFIASRWILRDFVRERSGERLRILIDGVSREGWRFVFVARLNPILPFNFMNYGLGLTEIALWEYSWTSFVAMAPGAFAFAYMGHAGGQALSGEFGLRQIFVAVGIVATLLYLPRLLTAVKKRP